MNIQLIEKIKLLKDYFLKTPDVKMVFVFGSYAKSQEISESDFDIGVYFKPEGNAIEWEETRYYCNEDKIWGDTEKIIGLKTDGLVKSHYYITD